MTIELKDASKVVRGITHIKPTSLMMKTGHFNVLLGQTGAGKTSLIKLMAGLDPIASGQVFFDGEDVTKLTTQRRNISLVHQFFVNYPHMTVFDNIASPLRVASMAKSEIQGRVQEAADILQLAPMLNRYPQELSGGQQQRCALARAIAKESRAVFLDEPLANLDYKLREELREQLPELFAGRGAVVVYATSEPEEALLLGGETILMEDGAVTQFGPTAEIYRKPTNLAAARVFSNPPINVLDMRSDKGSTWTDGDIHWNDPRSAQEGRYTFAIRPHHVRPERRSAKDIEITGRIIVIELSGSESSAHFEVNGRPWVSLAHGVHPFEVGEDHTFYMDPSQGFMFEGEAY